ncbi:MAG: UDP-2,3-diacylglucosamine diphosphatase [Cellvibrionaceae bacterium]
MILFISDLHLSPTRPNITKAFLHFLSTQAKGAEALYILGDFFDAWVGDDDNTSEYNNIRQALKNYCDSGTTLYFMHGNRDFLLGEDFITSTGATLLSDPTVITLGSEKTLLMHGDSLCTKDTDYMAFREMVRNPTWQATMLAKSLEERKALAAQLRETSQSMNSIKAEDIMDVTPAEVISEMTKHRCSRLIHGHTHRPARHSTPIDDKAGERIVLGDWHDQGWYLLAKGPTLELISFPIGENIGE